MKGVVGRMYVCIGQKQLRDCGSRRPTTYIVTCLVPFVTVSADSGRKSNYPAVRRVPHCHGERTQIALGPRSVAPQIRSSCPLDFIVIREDHTCVQQSGACETRLTFTSNQTGQFVTNISDNYRYLSTISNEGKHK